MQTLQTQKDALLKAFPPIVSWAKDHFELVELENKWSIQLSFSPCNLFWLLLAWPLPIHWDLQPCPCTRDRSVPRFKK